MRAMCTCACVHRLRFICSRIPPTTCFTCVLFCDIRYACGVRLPVTVFTYNSNDRLSPGIRLWNTTAHTPLHTKSTLIDTTKRNNDRIITIDIHRHIHKIPRSDKIWVGASVCAPHPTSIVGFRPRPRSHHPTYSLLPDHPTHPPRLHPHSPIDLDRMSDSIKPTPAG